MIKEGMQARNQLWKPEGKQRKSKPIPKKVDDPLCNECPNKKTCKHLCPPMTWINGNSPTKEILLSEICEKDLEYKDYNKDLAELIEDRQSRINSAIGIENVRRRSIAILLLAGISQKDIATLFSMSYRQINRIINKHK